MNRAAFSLMTCLVLRIAAPPAAVAQTDFGALHVTPGKAVRVTDASGNRVKGLLTDVQADSIRVGDRTFASSNVIKIERSGDSLWNGLAIGAGVGLVMAALPSEACFDKSGVECALTGMETGALVGLLVDGLHRGYTTVYQSSAARSVSVAPQIDRHRKGFAVSMRF